MGIDLRFPNITGTTEKEQLMQVKSYLYQLTEQLQWALNNIDTSATNHVVYETKISGHVVQGDGGTSLASDEPFDAEVAFADLKPLIIKSADIVEAYYEHINTRLAGLYVAESDFGTYIEETELEISRRSTDIEQLFTNIQQIVSDIENLNFTLAEVNAHIKSGKLYNDENGLPVYGIEIGQKNTIDGVEVFNKYARFISDRLSFYDHNGTEVAYISDRKLHISNVEITNSYKIGGFVDTVMASGDVVTKWVGKE